MGLCLLNSNTGYGFLLFASFFSSTSLCKSIWYISLFLIFSSCFTTLCCSNCLSYFSLSLTSISFLTFYPFRFIYISCLWIPIVFNVWECFIFWYCLYRSLSWLNKFMSMLRFICCDILISFMALSSINPFCFSDCLNSYDWNILLRFIMLFSIPPNTPFTFYL